MRIKKVVIQGFKTFAAKTEFVFDPGITAVVGPNGSGKSNIVDAVRWCLGEQSFSLLRSKKTADVIFSGSDKKARLNMAEVRLTLDNSSGEIPIDFDELEITRRAYRDGNNEYLINGQRVRLMDITELLAQTGLGKRTYALIGQGLIDKVLSLAPEERRALFEEAAGITAYQLKRTTTIRRLDATQQNLTRVQDITAELSPRLKYLKRQSDRALERTQIANDLRGLLRIWYGYRWHDALDKLELFSNKEKAHQQDMQMRQQTLNNIAGRIEVLRTRQVELRTRLGGLHNESSGLHQQAENTGRDLAVTRERQRQLQARREEIQRELAPLRLQQETLENRLAESGEQVAQAEEEAGRRRLDVEAMERTLAQRQAQRTRLQDALDQARLTADEVVRRRTESEARLAQLAERREHLLQEEQGQQAARRTANAELAKQTAELEAGNGKAAAVEADLQKTQAQIEQIAPRMEAGQQALAAAEQARQAADRTADRLQTRLDLLQRLHDEGAGYASGVRAVLQAAQQDAPELHGILGTVASLVQAPARLDKAIETALGGALQNVITQSWEETRDAIEYLKRTGRGRATFLPLDRLQASSPITAPSAQGILGNAADLVSYDRVIAPAVEQLLGRTWVAEDLETARRALDARRGGPRPTVVTLAGEIIRPGGSVTGGSDGNRRDDSILARERERRELPAQVEQANQAGVQAAERCGLLTQQLETLQLESSREEQRLNDLRRTERQVRGELEELRRRHDRSAQAVQWQSERLEQTGAELSRIQELETEHQQRLVHFAAEQQSSHAALTAARTEVEEAGIDDLLRELADLRTHAAESQGVLRSRQTLAENQRRSLQSIIDQIGAKEKRIEELYAEAESLTQRIETLDEAEDSLGAKLHVLRKEIDPAETELTALERNQREEETQERTVQQLLRADETNFNQAQLQRQRAEDAISQLQREIEHDLGLVTLEQSDEIAYQPPLPLAAFVEELEVVQEAPEGMEEEVREMRARLSRVSNVNPDAPREYDEAAARYNLLTEQSADLEAAAADLRKVIRELDSLMEIELKKTFTAVAEQFEHFFKLLFNGGTAKLVLTEPEDITNTGIEIIARPPGKRPQSLALLSGGERALSACSLIFAILRVSPTPFCVLDEVDAALDEANVDRFRQTVEDELSQDTQFIIVTHNRRTLEGANAIYGVTMGDDGVSKVMSLKLEEDRIVEKDGKEDDAALAEIDEIVGM
ncbi:MAG: chromosome segregation protein SMC [Caldilineaceae bacterium]|nr:chromosome segregation protein SMC [Caldilineaceae bacterium]